VVDGVEREITHLVVSARWVDGQLVTGARRSATAMITEIGTGTRRRSLTVW